MFLKLVKHELQETLRMLLPVFGGLLLFAAVIRSIIWIMELADNDILSIMGMMFVILFFMACGASVILTAVLLMVRFSKSVHGDEGYLTHTLPVGVHSILLSRLLITFLALASSICVAYLSIRFSTWNVASIEEFFDNFSVIFEASGLDDTFLWATVGTVFVQLLTTVLMIFAAISIGHSFNRGKAGFSILFFFALNTGVSMVSTVVSLILMPQLFETNVEMGAFTTQYYLFAVAMNLIFCGVFYFLAWIMTKKRLNLA